MLIYERGCGLDLGVRALRGQNSGGSEVGDKVNMRKVKQAGSKPFKAQYSLGTVSIAQGSAVLRGQGTNWNTILANRPSSAAHKGRIVISGGDEVYDVQLINTDGLMTLKRPFARDSVANATYVYFEGDHMTPDPKFIVSDEAVPASAVMAAQTQSSSPPPKTTITAPKTHAESAGDNAITETLKTIFYALLIALVIRIFVFQPFNIPSESMVSTLLKGDYIFVTKYSYGFSHHSIPFSPPIFSGRILGHAPTRGDVVVFKLPRDGHTDYIKRVIGLPGDTVQVRNSLLYVNGQQVKRERIDDFVSRDEDGNVTRTPAYRETLPNGVSYTTLDEGPGHFYDDTPEYKVPAGHYFMMGDNRDNSADSRADVGFVPFENLVGRAQFIFFSTDGSASFFEFWRWPTATRWDRIFKGIH